MKPTIVSIIGTRPNYIKVAVLNKKLETKFIHRIIDTGQHYDKNMSEEFYTNLKIPKPYKNLNIGSHDVNEQIAKIIKGCNYTLRKIRTKCVIVYGDTNSALGGAIAAANLNLHLIHVEAGIRSHDPQLQEERNRIVIDHLSNTLLTPSKIANDNLNQEGIKKHTNVGDIMYDIFLNMENDYTINDQLQLEKSKYIYSTIHRRQNTINKKCLLNLLKYINELSFRVVIPLHPATKNILKNNTRKYKNIKFISPVSYNQSISLQKYSAFIITDSGGIQKEAYWNKVPCFTLREKTEWIETVNSGWNTLVSSPYQLGKHIAEFHPAKKHPAFYGNGNAARKISTIIENIKI